MSWALAFQRANQTMSVCVQMFAVATHLIIWDKRKVQYSEVSHFVTLSFSLHLHSNNPTHLKQRASVWIDLPVYVARFSAWRMMVKLKLCDRLHDLVGGVRTIPTRRIRLGRFWLLVWGLIFGVFLDFGLGTSFCDGFSQIPWWDRRPW